jgi:hypothetical protein
MLRLALVVVPLLALAGCRTEKPGDGQPHPDGGGGPLDGSMSRQCKNSDDCTSMAGAPVCDLMQNGGTCAQCTASEHDRCSGPTPICTNDVCTGCTKHTDCPESNTCLPDGSCAQSSDVAYVDGSTGRDNTQCTKEMPCLKIDQAAAVKGIVKVSGTVTARCSLNDRNVTILAEPGAKLAPQSGDSGNVFEVTGNSNIQVYDLQISDGDRSTPGSGVTVSDPANLELTRVVLRDNGGNGATIRGGNLTCTQCLIAHNGDRGIYATAGVTTVLQSTIVSNLSGGVCLLDNSSFHIVENFIYGNGQINRVISGGVYIQDNQQMGAPANELNFNSISHNTTFETNLGQGIHCTIGGTPLIASNNIIWDNGMNPATSMQVDSGAGCSFAFSDIGPMGIGSANSNMNTDPMFLNEASGDLHLNKDSPVVGKADPNATLSGLAAKDIDGQPRIAPADIGADQLPR